MNSPLSLRVRMLAVLALLFSVQHATAVAPSGGVQSEYTLPHVPNQLLVRREPGVPVADIEQLLAGFGGTLLTSGSASRIDVFEIDNDGDLEAAIIQLEADSRVTYAEPNSLVELWATPNDLDFPQQWSKDNTGINAPSGLGNAGADLNMVSAWDRQTAAPGIMIAIIDDSLETTHVDLTGNVAATGRCFASPNSARPCNNGPNDPNPSNANEYHGTLVAGAAAARGNNGIGIAGVVWETSLLPLKVDLSWFAIVEAVDEAITQDAAIINMSFGGPGQSESMRDAVARAEAAGILVVASAGNADANNDIASHYPSDTELDNVVSVAATDGRDRITGFSQWGPTDVDVAAPGDFIRTTANGNSYAFVSGTSFSAPHAAGVAALIQAATGAADYRRLKAHILHGTVNGQDALGPVVPGQDIEAVPGRVSTGRLDADKALAGPTGGVLIIEAINVDDTAAGNGNGVLDAGETASLDITLANVWSAETDVTGSLVSGDTSKLTVNDGTPQMFGTITDGGQATAGFSVTLSNGVSGNNLIFMQLDLMSATTGALPSRYFYIESGTLQNGVTVSQSIQRYDWDEFQAFNISVPAGATDLNVTTTGTGDIDLLLRHGRSPEYLITLDAAANSGFYYVDSDSMVSAQAGANESLSVPNPAPGSYHAVVVNYDQQEKTYDITASYTIPTAGTISIDQPAYTVDEESGSATISVTRTGGVGGASVNFETLPETATAGSDYLTTSGTLTWAIAENGAKTFDIPIIDDQTTEGSETLQVQLRNASGATLGSPDSALLEIVDNDDQGGMLAFARTQYSVFEGEAQISIDVQRSGGTLGAATVSYRTVSGQAIAGSDFVDASGSVSWLDGEGGSKSIAVSIVNDSSIEESESFALVLSDAQGATIGSPETTTVSISDDDLSGNSGSGGGGAMSLVELAFACLLFAPLSLCNGSGRNRTG